MPFYSRNNSALTNCARDTEEKVSFSSAPIRPQRPETQEGKKVKCPNKVPPRVERTSRMKEYESFVHIVVLVPKNNIGYISVEILYGAGFFFNNMAFCTYIHT